MSTPATNLVGAALGAYQIEALIGSGGMASVYRAFDTNLQRPVAIKVLSSTVAAEPGFVDRFRQEARTIARLRHPHIVHVYDLGETNGVVYMVQELLPGPTLSERLRDLSARGVRLAPQEIVTITAHLAGALDAAHAAGIVHRDVKPANALWNDAGALVLTDFGIAKNTLAAIHQTQIGTVLGTPAYLAPEQAQGQPATPASDIYALGVVLYELIAGDVPFTGVTPMQVVLRHVQEPPPPLAPRRPGLPLAVEAVVQRALAKEPSARFASAGELARALEGAWLSAPAAVGTSTITDIHQQPTRLWQPPAAPPAAAQVPAQTSAPAQPAALPFRPAAPLRQAGTQRRLLPILAGALATLLVIASLLAWRGGRQAATPQATMAPTAEQTAAPAPTPLAAEPTAAPAEAAPPPPASDGYAQLQSLLESGIAAGKAGEDGEELTDLLGEAQGAAASGDKGKATASLHKLKATVLKGVGKGTVAPDFGQQVLRAVDAIP